ncbi:MAG: hypothetical protein UY48_C0029G0014 [Candidatus Gottesmanbacteria bacterium GW2011_GWB1_49_7]|uniref:Uncharacterized protein n=1 Tax=Candidatus Gottesmanbacteria bacterium GW2011_GWB1_49_7 TaxID=1618448 RepID=A0A0G1Y7H5_9BACT|nr:MAG: hypothetical protein UY48_C0029G0014 [Candidatus Gottesmanbacteria bacterium GW2011_GWB1_49_7]
MIPLTVSFIAKDFSDIGEMGKISYRVQRYSQSVLGGPNTATIAAFGSFEALYNLTQKLRCGVLISDTQGRDVWWGYLDGVEINAKGLRLSVGLAGMWNTIYVQYTNDVVATTTAAGTHAASIASYGTKEIIVSASDLASSTAAEAMRDRLVEFYGLPRVERTPSDNPEMMAVLTCAGWWNTLNWRYYTNAGTDTVDTTALIADIVTTSGALLAGSELSTTSSITMPETRSGDQRAGDEIAKLLIVGISGGNRLKAKVTKGRILRVEAEPSSGASDYRWVKGRLYDNNNYPVQPQECPAGMWVEASTGLWGSATTSVLVDTGKFFVEEAEYDALADTWTPTPRGSYIPGEGSGGSRDMISPSLDKIKASQKPWVYNIIQPGIGARVYNSTDFSHTSSGSWVPITFDTERFDTDGIHSTVSNTSRLTINKAGKYLIGGLVRFAPNTVGQRALRISLDGTIYIASVQTHSVLTSVGLEMQVCTIYDLAVANYLELEAYQDSGGTLAITASTYYSPVFWCWKLT